MTQVSHSSRARITALLAALATFTPAGVRGQGDVAVSVRQVVMDITSYTRWPEPRPDLRFCVVGPALYGQAFLQPGLQSGAVPIVAQRMAIADDRISTSCDIVYEGPLSPNEREELVLRIAGRPVLTIGEPDPGCIDVTMFCLSIRGDQVFFASNLDAIARSGVKLNPRVLLLGRRPGTVR